MPAAMTWYEREVPILEAVHAREEAGDRTDLEDIVEATGLDSLVAGRAVRSLVESGRLEGIDATGGDDVTNFLRLRLLEPARRDIGQWPPGPAEALIALLDRRIDTATDPYERTRLERFRDAAVLFVRDVGAQTAGTILGNAAGGFM
jgi:hypothetical protein